MARKSQARDGDGILAELQKQGALMKGNDKRLILQRIPTGVPELDAILNGGIPRGRISIFTGEYSSGKSFLVQLLMQEALSKKLSVAYIDTEKTYDPVWWEQVGLNTKEVYVSQPNTGEEATKIVLSMVHAGIDVVAIDSLAAMVPMAEAKDSETKFMGEQARLINRLCRSLLSINHQSVIACTNQLRATIGGPSPVETMPGGKGQGFFASLILRMRRDGWLEESGERVGFNLRIICRKSKVGKPFGECTLPFRFRGEIDRLAMLVDQGLEAGLVEQNGPWYTLKMQGAEDAALGKNALITRLREEEGLRDRLATALGGKDR